MWVDYDGEHILTSSPAASYKSRALRVRPQVAVSVVDPADPWRRLSISGRVTEIHGDEELAFINRMSQRYTGRPYPRPGAREVFALACHLNGSSPRTSEPAGGATAAWPRQWSGAKCRLDPRGIGHAPESEPRAVEAAARRVVAGVPEPGLDVDAISPDPRRAREAKALAGGATGRRSAR